MERKKTYDGHSTVEPGSAKVYDRLVAHWQLNPLARLLIDDLPNLALDLVTDR